MEDSKKKKDVQQDATASEGKRKPIKTFRVEEVSASVWSRERQVNGETRTFYSVTPERSYKDRDGAYRYTNSFDADSLGKLVTVVQQAHEFINAQEA